MITSKDAQLCWLLRKLLLPKSLRFTTTISNMRLQVNQLVNILIKTSDHWEIQITIDADLLCTNMEKCQRKVIQIHTMCTLFSQKPSLINQFNLLMMVQLQMIAYKVTLVTAGWSVLCLCSQLEMNFWPVEEQVWNMITIWLLIKKLHPFYLKVFTHQFSKNSERSVYTSLDSLRTSLGFTLLLMRGYQLAKLPIFQSLVDAEIFMKSGSQLLRKHMLKCMDVMKISPLDM